MRAAIVHCVFLAMDCFDLRSCCDWAVMAMNGPLQHPAKSTLCKATIESRKRRPWTESRVHNF
jgi:hypothetical protein